MLAEGGYHGTGIKQVLDAVGVPKGSFYNFFPSKESYVASLIYHYGEQMANELKQAIGGFEKDPALVQLWRIFHALVHNKIDSGQSCACLLGAMSAEIAHDNPLCRAAIATVEGQWIGALQGYIQRAQEQGDLRGDLQPQDIAVLLYNCWQGSLLHYQVSDDHNELLRQLSIFFSTLLTQQGQFTLSNLNIYNII